VRIFAKTRDWKTQGLEDQGLKIGDGEPQAGAGSSKLTRLRLSMTIL
jgi:hypothetical protein